jgi:hypothetical protein
MIRFGGVATVDTRFSFAAQFLCASAFFAREASKLEATITSIDDRRVQEHRAFVVGAVMQSVAALEAEIAEVVMYGPGCHLGSNHTDNAAKEFLEPLADLLTASSGVIEKFDLVLHLLGKKRLDHSIKLWADSTRRSEI